VRATYLKKAKKRATFHGRAFSQNFIRFGLAASTLATIAASAAIATAATVTAAATASTTTIAAATAASASWSTWFARTSFVYRQGPAFYRLAIVFGNRFLRIGFRRHRDESKAARFAGEFILHQGHFLHRSNSREHVLKISLGRVEGKISYV
jgi:hypothetical protein